MVNHTSDNLPSSQPRLLCCWRDRTMPDSTADHDNWLVTLPNTLDPNECQLSELLSVKWNWSEIHFKIKVLSLWFSLSNYYSFSVYWWWAWFNDKGLGNRTRTNIKLQLFRFGECAVLTLHQNTAHISLDYLIGFVDVSYGRLQLIER